MSDELLRRGRAMAYRMRQDNQGQDAKLVEDLCGQLEAYDKALRALAAPIPAEQEEAGG